MAARAVARRLRLPVCLAGAGAGLALYVRDADKEYRALPEEALPQHYDPVQIAAVWRKHPRCAIARLTEIGAATLPFCVRLAADYTYSCVTRTANAADSEAQQTQRAKELREILTKLGPTFIKFGQMLSIRPDAIPPSAVYELQKLCDAVPSYPTIEALKLIECELGRPAVQMFDELDGATQPIAAASLGQVYRCRLRGSGQQVALKVQRPDMIRAVSLDLYLLRCVMHAVEWFKKNILTGILGAADRSSFDVKLLDTFANASYKELDYVHEGNNLERFRTELVPLLNGKVRVPQCFWEVTSRKVLVTEWIEGEQLAKSSPAVINRLITTGVDCFLTQLLRVSFFHSDPHPGNLLVDAEERLVLIDFGLCAHIDSLDSRAITSAIVNLMRGHVEGLVDDAIALRFLPADVDKTALLPPLRRIFDQGRLAAAHELTTRSRKGGIGTAQRRAQFSAISRDLNQIFYEFPFSVPDYFALLTRALIVLEGIALTGDPDFDLFQAAYPYAAKHAAKLFGASQFASMLGEAAIAASSLQSVVSPTAEADVSDGLATRSYEAPRRFLIDCDGTQHGVRTEALMEAVQQNHVVAPSTFACCASPEMGIIGTGQHRRGTP